MLALFLAIALLGTDGAYGRSIIDLTGVNHDNTDLGGSELYAKAGAYYYGDDDPIDLTAAKVNNLDLTGLGVTAESSIGLDPSRPSPSAKPASILAAIDAGQKVFMSTAALKTAVQAYNTDPAAATAAYGLIANWDVSAITDMSGLFDHLDNFDADISNWKTSSVTTMQGMFSVRSARALRPQP